MDGRQILAFFIAFIPGMMIALIADYLSRRRDTQREARVNENARTLLALEISALYGQVLTIPDDERAILDHERFWYNRFAGNRIRFFERLQRQVTETLSLGNPLEQK
jgi:hypothetical protein